MNRALLAVLLALPITGPVFAQSPPDFSVRIEALAEGPAPADRIPVGQTVFYVVHYGGVFPIHASGVTLEVEVPGALGGILSSRGVECARSEPVRCAFTTDAEPFGFVQIDASIDEPGLQTATARILTTIPESSSTNNTATHTTEAVPLPSLELGTFLWFEELGPGEPAIFATGAFNHASTPATNVTLDVTLLAGGTITSAVTRDGKVSCRVSGENAVCTRDRLGRNESFEVDLRFTAPDRADGQLFLAKLEVKADQEDFDPSDDAKTISAPMIRQFVVTNVSDEGSGSLRQALLEASASCGPGRPCRIAFRIPSPVPDRGWFTIQPRTPLPVLEGDVTIDGATQTAFTGQTNPVGPEIEINGALVSGGSGLRLRPNCEVEVFGLAVNGFPWYGIEVNRHAEDREVDSCFSETWDLRATIAHNVLGTDPGGRVAVPNGRGLGLFTFYSTVEDNLISGNTRSGVFAQDGFYARIRRNRIGVAFDGSPLGNGASGIFFDMGDQWFGMPGGADVEENVIANNDHWAVARTRRGEIEVTGNSMYGNRHQAIDVDLDLVTPNRPDDADFPNHPVLYAAFYDPATQSTIVRGRLDSEGRGFARFEIEVFSSFDLSLTNGSQAQHSVAKKTLDSGHEDFEISIPMDLRGKWISAVNHARHIVGFSRPRDVTSHTHYFSIPGNTSELSNSVSVP